MSAFQLFINVTVLSATAFVVWECACAWEYLEKEERVGWFCFSMFTVGSCTALALYVNGVLS